MPVSTQRWRIAYWVLFAVWVTDAVLVLAKVRGGLFTAYAADLTLPAFLYIVFRGLHKPARPHWTSKFFGATPELAASILFFGSALTEITQIYWPQGIFGGVFDPFDILAYAVGVGSCYLLDKMNQPASGDHAAASA